MDFTKIPKDKTEEFTVTIQLRFSKSKLTIEEIDDRVQRAIAGYRTLPSFSNLIVEMLRETRSSLWELVQLEVSK